MSQDKQPESDKDDESRGNSEDNEKPEAGFDVNFKIPGLKAHFWGGKEQLHLIWPWLRWLAIGAFSIWGLREIVRVFQ